jgi:tRNA threonylcarbamoyl adenosine modification protein (Sua5/YciO/YrdC/YwlC family)
MVAYIDIHPVNPQPRLITRVIAILRSGGLIAYPTDSCYALGCALDNADGLDRIRRLRRLDARHHFTLVCSDFSQVGQLVQVNNATFRLLRATTPGAYTFILPALRDVPRRMMHPKKLTVGVRIPAHPVTQALLAELGEPMVSSTLILPGESEPLTSGWEIRESIGHALEAVVEGGDCGREPTTVVDLTELPATIVREGAGDPAPFR